MQMKEVATIRAKGLRQFSTNERKILFILP